MVVALEVTRQGGQGLPRVRPDRHGERRGDPILPSESEGVRSRPVGRSARGDRWSPRSPERCPGGLQGTGAHPAVPVAQAGERDLVSAESGGRRAGASVCSGAYQRPTYEEAVKDLKALRQELAGVNQSAAASLDEGFEENPHPPPVGSLPPGRPVAQDHQRARVRERPGRAEVRTRGPLEELEPEAPMARDHAPGRSSHGSGGCSGTDTSRSSGPRSRRTSGSPFPRAVHMPSPETGGRSSFN